MTPVELNGYAPHFRKALETVRDQAAARARQEVLASIGEAFVRQAMAAMGGGVTAAPPDLFAKAAQRAPAGGVSVGGKQFRGGEFIPSEVMDLATDEEKAAVAGSEQDARGGEAGQRQLPRVNPDPARERSYGRKDEPPAAVKQAFAAWHPTAEQKEALAAYTDPDDAELEGPTLLAAVRGGTASPKQQAAYRAVVGAVNSAPTLPEPVRVFRGFRFKNVSDRDAAVAKLAADGVYRLTGGVSSSSLDPGYAAGEFSDEDTGVVFDIETDRGAWVDPLAPSNDQREVLLPDGEFEVTAIGPAKVGRRGKTYTVVSLRRNPGAKTNSALFAKAAAHSPTGGVTIAGKHYPGGQFIPAAEMAKASPEEKAELERKQAGGGDGTPTPKDQTGQYGAWGRAAAGIDDAPAPPASADRATQPLSREERAKRAEKAKAAVEKAVADPKAIKPHELRALHGHFLNLSKEQQKEYARRLREKVGGTKAELADRLRERIKAERVKKEGTRVMTAKVDTLAPDADSSGYEVVGRPALSREAALRMNAGSDVVAVQKRGGKWVALREKVVETPDVAEDIPAVTPAETGTSTEELPSADDLLPAETQNAGLKKRQVELATWLDALSKRRPQTRYGNRTDREILELRDSMARKVNALRQAANGGQDVADELGKFEPRLAELNAEKEHRQEVAKAKRRAAAIEEGLKTGKLTLHDEEMRELLGKVGDAYKDVGYRGEYNPDAMRTSDLTGRKIRRYVELPDGRIAHPDELTLAQKRGRIIVEGQGVKTASPAPPEVLADYPDLAANQGAAATTPPPATTPPDRSVDELKAAHDEAWGRFNALNTARIKNVGAPANVQKVGDKWLVKSPDSNEAYFTTDSKAEAMRMADRYGKVPTSDEVNEAREEWQRIRGEYESAATADPPPTPPTLTADETAELSALNRKPARQLTPGEKARRDELSRKFSANKWPGSTPIVMGGGRGPGNNGEQSNEGTAFAERQAAFAAAQPSAPTSAPKTRDQLDYLPKDPKRLTIDQANQALADLGYEVVKTVGGDSGDPTDTPVRVVRTPAGEERELTPTGIRTLLYGDSALPVAARLNPTDLGAAFRRAGRGQLLGPANVGGNGKPVSWRVRDADGREVVLSDDEVRQAVVGAGLARGAGGEKQNASGSQPIEYVRAAAGGQTSEVDGKFYRGGQLMPVHGKYSGQVKPPKGEGVGAVSEPAKSNEDAEGGAGGRRPARPLSPDELDRVRQEAEDQKKWDEIRTGPLGQFKWVGDRVNSSALDPMKRHTNLDQWRKFAESAGPDGVAKIVAALEPQAHAAIDRQAPDKEASDWYKDDLRRRAADAQNSTRGGKGHEKQLPGSHYARELIHEMMDPKNHDGDVSAVDALHRVNSAIAGAITATAQSPAQTPATGVDHAAVAARLEHLADRNPLASGGGVEAIRAVRPDLERMSHSDVQAVARSLGYEAAAAGKGKRALIDHLIGNMESRYMSRLRGQMITGQDAGANLAQSPTTGVDHAAVANPQASPQASPKSATAPERVKALTDLYAVRSASVADPKEHFRQVDAAVAALAGVREIHAAADAINWGSKVRAKKGEAAKREMLAYAAKEKLAMYLRSFI